MSFYQAHKRRPDFQLCDSFSDKGDQSVSCWLRKLEWELQGYTDEEGIISAAEFLHTVNVLLTDDAVTWAEITLDVSELLKNSALTSVTVTVFRSLFIQKYSVCVLKTSAVSFDSEIADLWQFDEESLLIYYKRTASLLFRVEERNRPHQVVAASLKLLSLLEAAMLNTVMQTFIKGLQDSDVHWDALHDLVSADHSFIDVYTLTEESRQMKVEYTWLQKEVVKSQKLQFYWELIQCNMPATQIEALKMFYNASMISQWGYHQSPPPSPQSSFWFTLSLQSFTFTCQEDYSLRHDDYYSSAPHQNFIDPSFHSLTAAFNSHYLITSVTILYSQNPYVNELMVFILSQRNIVCIKCEKSEHLSQDCREVPLPHLKQAVLQNIILSDRNALLSLPSSIRSLISVTINSALTSSALRVDSHSVTFEFSDLNVNADEVQSIDALIEKGSGLNKRSHVKESTQLSLTLTVELQPDISQGQSFMFQTNVS